MTTQTYLFNKLKDSIIFYNVSVAIVNGVVNRHLKREDADFLLNEIDKKLEDKNFKDFVFNTINMKNGGYKRIN